jgi:phosphoribosylpyrophosphate synthetase
MLSDAMNLFDLSITQLKRATAIKEQIEDLNKDLRSILGVSAKSGAAPKNKRIMSAATKRKIAAAQKRRLANLRRAKPATQPVKPATKAKKKVFSSATRAKLSAKLKAFWAVKKAGKK